MYTRESLQKLCEELKVDFGILKIEENEKYEKSIISGPCQEIGCDNTFSLGFRTFRRGAKCRIHLLGYTVEFLKEFCARYKIKLIGSYENINSKSIIKAFCAITGCTEIFEKPFCIMVEKPYCVKCTNQNRKERFKQTCLEKYGTTSPLQNPDVKEKRRQTSLKKYGVPYALQNSEVKKKAEQTNLERYGVKNAAQNSKIKEKVKQTNIEKRGVAYVTQDPEVKEKTKQTNIEKRGVAYATQDPEIKEKIKQTNLIRYGAVSSMQNFKVQEKAKQTNIEKRGVAYVSQDPEVYEKIKQTTLERYGTPYISQNSEIKEKKKQTNLVKYGVPHSAQNSEVHSKRLASSYSKKEFTLPSGVKIFLQGYEPYALEILLKKYAEEEIITKAEKMPELWWTDATEQKHRHFIDFYIPKTNTMIEVKSDYTLTRGLEASLRKQDAALKENYSYEIWVINKKKKQTAIIYQTIPSIIIKWYNKDDRLKEVIEKGIKLLQDSKE